MSLWLPRATIVVDRTGGRPGAGGDQGDRGAHRPGRGAGYWQEGACLLHPGARCGRAGQAAAGGGDLPDDDPLAAGVGRPAGGAGGDPGGDGGDQRLLAAGVLPAGGPGVGDLAGQRPRGEAPARAAQDRPAGCGVAGQARRAGHAAAQFRAASGDPAAAGPDPLPRRPGRGAHRREAAGGEAAGGRPDQAVGGGRRHLRGLGAGHAGRLGRRRA